MDDLKPISATVGVPNSDYHSFSFALPHGQGFLTGEFSYDVGTQKWHWSAETYAIHGFDAGDVVPTTALVLAHKHAEDRSAFAELFQRAQIHGGRFASHHRIIDAQGKTKHILMVADSLTDAFGDVLAVTGHFVDLTEISTRVSKSTADEAVARAVEKRHFIDQAKGILMARLHIDSEAAFAQLGQWATRDNRKLRTVAEELVTSFQTSLASPRSDDSEPTVTDPWHADHAL